MSEERYLTTSDALAYLRTTPRTLYRHLAAGAIPGVRMGRQWRFRKNDLDLWIEQQSRRARAGGTAARTLAETKEALTVSFPEREKESAS